MKEDRKGRQFAGKDGGNDGERERERRKEEGESRKEEGGRGRCVGRP